MLNVRFGSIPLNNSVTSRDSQFVRGASEEKPADEVQRFAYSSGQIEWFLGPALDVEVRFRLKLVPLVLGE